MIRLESAYCAQGLAEAPEATDKRERLRQGAGRQANTAADAGSERHRKAPKKSRFPMVEIKLERSAFFMRGVNRRGSNPKKFKSARLAQRKPETSNPHTANRPAFGAPDVTRNIAPTANRNRRPHKRPFCPENASPGHSDSAQESPASKRNVAMDVPASFGRQNGDRF